MAKSLLLLLSQCGRHVDWWQIFITSRIMAMPRACDRYSSAEASTSRSTVINLRAGKFNVTVPF
jgi:hypothetical protein